MKTSLFLGLTVSLTMFLSFAQGQFERAPTEQLVLDWFDRWNALDGSDEATERVVELYRLDAMHILGPNARQIGLVTFNSIDAIRKMIADFARGHESINFRIKTVTSNEQSTDLFHRANGPWGGVGVAVEFVAVYTERETKKRFMHPGAMFFQLLDGRIHRARTYLGHRERAEITPFE